MAPLWLAIASLALCIAPLACDILVATDESGLKEQIAALQKRVDILEELVQKQSGECIENNDKTTFKLSKDLCTTKWKQYGIGTEIKDKKLNVYLHDTNHKYFYANEFSITQLQHCGFSDQESERLESVSAFLLKMFEDNNDELSISDDDKIKKISIKRIDPIWGTKEIVMDLNIIERQRSDILMEYVADLKQTDAKIKTIIKYYNDDQTVRWSKDYDVELNLLMRNIGKTFTFSAHPNTILPKNSPRNIVSRVSNKSLTKYVTYGDNLATGYLAKYSKEGEFKIVLDFGKPLFVTKYSLSGFSKSPVSCRTTSFFELSGSSDGKVWTVLSKGDSKAVVDGKGAYEACLNERIMNVHNPGSYRYYQFRVEGYSEKNNDGMMIFNAGLWASWTELNTDII